MEVCWKKTSFTPGEDNVSVSYCSLLVPHWKGNTLSTSEDKFSFGVAEYRFCEYMCWR